MSDENKGNVSNQLIQRWKEAPVLSVFQTVGLILILLAIILKYPAPLAAKILVVPGVLLEIVCAIIRFIKIDKCKSYTSLIALVVPLSIAVRMFYTGKIVLIVLVCALVAVYAMERHNAKD